MPQLEAQERENPPAVVAAAAAVLVEELLDGARLELVAAGGAGRRGASRARSRRATSGTRRPPGSRSPSCGRRIVARRQPALGGALVHVLAGHAAQLEGDRQRFDDAHEIEVEERHPRLERVRHRHLVAVQQEIVRQREPGIDVEELRQTVQVARLRLQRPEGRRARRTQRAPARVSGRSKRSRSASGKSAWISREAHHRVALGKRTRGAPQLLGARQRTPRPRESGEPASQPKDCRPASRRGSGRSQRAARPHLGP